MEPNYKDMMKMFGHVLWTAYTELTPIYLANVVRVILGYRNTPYNTKNMAALSLLLSYRNWISHYFQNHHAQPSRLKSLGSSQPYLPPPIHISIR